ncbi:hypothetical protein [Yersinia aleksiciae]|uniref:hypothetical protein n=1 Tax=Yersinia aleksiciae TaxID=263819 RepID=UPI003990BFF9
MLPRWLVGEALREGQLQEILSGSTGLGLPIHVVWLKGGVMPARLRVTIDALVAVFTPQPPW